MGDKHEWLKLFLHEAKSADVYKDTARIHESNRAGIKAGRICRLFAKGFKSTLVAVRGLKDEEQLDVRIDEVTRERLGISHLEVGKLVEVRLREAWLLERIWWVMNASDPAARVSIWIAVISLVLGAVALVWTAFSTLYPCS